MSNLKKDKDKLLYHSNYFDAYIIAVESNNVIKLKFSDIRMPAGKNRNSKVKRRINRENKVR